MSLNNIPKDKKMGFPAGVSEKEYDTIELMDAFLTGLDYADDCDVSHGEVFERDNKYVVRVAVGEFGEWEEDDEV